MLLSALLAFAAPSAAQSSPPTPARPRASAPSVDSALNKRVSLDLKAMAPRDAFKVIATAIGYTAEVAPDVSTPVDIVVGNISAKTALNTICESIGCTWQASGTVIHVEKAGHGTVVVTRRDPATRANEVQARSAGVAELRRLMDQVLPADMKFDHAPLAEVAERLSKATGFEITLTGARSDETFSGDLGGRPFSAALKTICEQLDGKVAIITGRKGTGAPSIRIQVVGARRPRK
jgi:type II secretory pathway component GspD/PulD (secretin)